MSTTDELTAKIAAARDKSSRILCVASPSPDLMRANESAYAALAVLLAGHTDEGVYLAAEECDHPEPEATGWAGWDTWVINHPDGTAADSRDNPRICKLTEIGRHCPACTLLVYDEEANGENYVPAGDCLVRPVIARQFTGEA